MTQKDSKRLHKTQTRLKTLQSTSASLVLLNDPIRNRQEVQMTFPFLLISHPFHYSSLYTKMSSLLIILSMYIYQNFFAPRCEIFLDCCIAVSNEEEKV